MRVADYIQGDQLGLRHSEDYGHALLGNVALKFSEDGLAVFSVPNGFFFRSQVPDKLRGHGVYVNAVFGLPPYTFIESSITLNLFVLSRTDTSDYFVAELTDIEKRNQGVLKLFGQRRAGKDPSMGVLVDPAGFTNVRAVMQKVRLEQTAEELGLSPVILDEVAADIELIDSREVTEHPFNAVYIPQRPGPVYALPAALTANKYWRVVLDPAKANADYVARLLNSNLGKSILSTQRTGTTIPNLPKSRINTFELYLPSIDTQEKIVEIDVEVDTLVADLTELRGELWSTPQKDSQAASKIRAVLGGDQELRDRFEDWLDTLPFPLASILWVYHATNDPYKKYRLLQRYFEGLTQFMATVLLSGFYYADDWITERHKLFNKYSKEGVADTRLRHASFGIWKSITEALSSDLYHYTQPDQENPTEE